MFYYLNGTVTVLEANLAVIDVGGVGYACHTTAYTLSQLQLGKPCKLFTYCYIKEEAFDIFGFATREEQNLFLRLLAVSGVGPKAALSILSAVTPDQFILAVVTGDEKTLMLAQGVGKKMAQRILLELKDKLTGTLPGQDGAAPVPLAAAAPGGKATEAAAALAALGYSQSEIGLALKGVDVEHLSVEEIVRAGLRAMVKQ
ncbi:MAG TPA: Holliday junction branch migration protein RuvA [Candidatus Avoscillospira avicola]|uniref:Holliday junction branch migration complex subunit RuvA n=1 Tax=Candidatus Avoscillospira avicola TaxID=2840706 RepID=A0A9D1IWH7_9FIRM|nr:Holliday junction branch migration protein RuvA [Candidatus Avoscillospira avicola]